MENQSLRVWRGAIKIATDRMYAHLRFDRLLLSFSFNPVVSIRRRLSTNMACGEWEGCWHKMSRSWTAQAEIAYRH